MQGKFIAIEGLSCSGKSTSMNILKNKLKDNENKYIFCGGFDLDECSSSLTKLCNQMAQQATFLKINYIAEFHLLIAEMMNEIFERIIPAINAGKVVFYNNYISSVIAFEKGIYYYDKKFKTYIDKTIVNLNKLHKLPIPDITIFVNASISTTVKRLELRDDYKDKEVNLIQNNIYEEYLKVLPSDTIFIDNETTFENLNLNIEKLLDNLKEKNIL